MGEEPDPFEEATQSIAPPQATGQGPTDGVAYNAPGGSNFESTMPTIPSAYGYAGTAGAYGGAPYYGNTTSPYYNAASQYQYLPNRMMTAFQQQQQQQNANNTNNPAVMLQEAMSRFARVSTLIDDILRNLHMLFDSVFGLAYAIGAVRNESRLWLSIKCGPVMTMTRVFRVLSSSWRLGILFLLSPMAGKFSPVVLVLKILGLVPAEYSQQEQQQNEDEDEARDQGEEQEEQTETKMNDNEHENENNLSSEDAQQNDQDNENLVNAYQQNERGHAFI